VTDDSGVRDADSADAPPADDELGKVVPQPEEPDLRDDIAIARELERLERKPPLYRFFRGAMYGLYMLAAVWLIGAMAISAWQAVYGEAGRKLRARQAQTAPIRAIPGTPAAAPPAPATQPPTTAPQE